jgi:Ras-related GTP-binding protein C/D
MHSFMDFQVWEFPGHLNYFDPSFDSREFLRDMGAMIWVIDAQDDYFDSIIRACEVIIAVKRQYPNIHIVVFVHKVDGLSDEYRQDTYESICQRIEDELSDAAIEPRTPGKSVVSYYQTSIYDHTIFEALSKVIQKLIPTYELAALESLLDSLVNSCRIEKAYLFDVLSKIYIAQDTGPTEPGSYEVCSDHIDVVIDISEIYGWCEDNDSTEKGNGDAESVVMLGPKENCYIYVKEINK